MYIELFYEDDAVEAQIVQVGQKIELYFMATLPALSMVTYRILDHERDCELCAKISTFNNDSRELVSNDLKITLDDIGLIQRAEFEAEEYEVHERFIAYFPSEYSGPYAFMPESEGFPIEM